MTSENRPLTALRGIAALWVVLHHLDQGWQFPLPTAGHAALLLGRVAVDVFFVLSGFILAEVYHGLRWTQVGGFLLRRAGRIYPVHVAVLGAVGVLSALAELRAPGVSVHPWETYGPVLLLIQPYLGIGTPWNPPTWSAGVELCCYVLFPLGIAVLRPSPPWLLVIAAAGLATAEWLVLRNHDGATTGPGAILRGLAGFWLGATLAGLAASLPRPAWLQATAALAMGAGIVADDPAWVTLAAAALIAGLGAGNGPVAGVLGGRAVVWLGHVSFSVYVLHIPLYVFFSRLPPVRAALATPVLRFAVAAAFLAVLLPLAALTWRWIEQPGRRLARLVERRRQPRVAMMGEHPRELGGQDAAERQVIR